LVKLDKIYTRGGDEGSTSLGDGSRVKKNNLRVVAYGDLDEANSCLGIAIAFSSKEIKRTLLRIQNDLFDIGADLCYPENSERKVSISKENINFLEVELDKINRNLNELDSFILPGGSKSSAFFHLTRSIVRRAERSIVELSQKENVNPNILKYMNRLSDFLFVVARFENKKDGDILWIPNKKV
jgi:cob(I)alamin adenosyltransferase